MSENLKFSMLNDHIGELVLSQPKRRNALNAAMWAGLPGVLKAAENTKGLKVLIVELTFLNLKRCMPRQLLPRKYLTISQPDLKPWLNFRTR